MARCVVCGRACARRYQAGPFPRVCSEECRRRRAAARARRRYAADPERARDAMRRYRGARRR